MDIATKAALVVSASSAQTKQELSVAMLKQKQEAAQGIVNMLAKASSGATTVAAPKRVLDVEV
ncbi:MAG: hypothetical protein KDE22_08415 [Rhodobacterales bacterium]|nr:hypothetical protein [Rhodobacterales bacterium]